MKVDLMAESFKRFLNRKPDLKELSDQVTTNKWFLLGVQLECDTSKLNEIAEIDESEEYKTVQMFQLWLNLLKTKSIASRRILLDGLRKRVVNEILVANNYEKYLKELHDRSAYCSTPSDEAYYILQQHMKALNDVLISPVNVSQMLYSKRCIDEAILDEIEVENRSFDDKKTHLLIAIQGVVRNNYKKLKDIATVLSEIDETQEIAHQLIQEYNHRVASEECLELMRQEVIGHKNPAVDILRTYYSSLSQSILEPAHIANILHKEDVFSDGIVSSVESEIGSLSDRRAVLLRALRKVVQSNYAILEILVTVLRKFPETAQIGDRIFEEYMHHFGNFNAVEEIDLFLMEKGQSIGGPTSDNEKEMCKHGYKIIFPRGMKQEFRDIRVKFATSFHEIRIIFSKKKININDVKVFIADFRSDLTSQLQHKKTKNDILEVIKRNCTIVDVHCLEVTMTHFKVNEALTIIRSYKELATEFCKTVALRLCLEENLKVTPSPPHLMYETITFVLNWKPDTQTLQDIRDVLEDLDPLNNYHILIEQFGTGQSVFVSCYCPGSYMILFVITVFKKIKILQKRGLKEFKVGNCTVWSTVKKVEFEASTKALDVTTYPQKDLEDDKHMLSELKQQQLVKENDHERKKEQLYSSTATLDELNAKLEIQSTISKRKGQEIDDLKILIKEKNNRITFLEGELETLQELLSEKQTDYKETAKNAAVAFDEDMTGKVDWSGDEVKLNNPSLIQCQEVISQLTDNHQNFRLERPKVDVIQYLVPLVLQKSTIKRFSISYTQLTPDLIHSISSNHMSTNTSLKRLALLSGAIDDIGVILLAQSLKYNKTLTSLSLYNNPQITSASASSLAELIHTNHTLTELSVSRSSLDSNGVLLMLNALLTNKTLTRLEIDNRHENACSAFSSVKHIITFY